MLQRRILHVKDLGPTYLGESRRDKVTGFARLSLHAIAKCRLFVARPMSDVF